MFNLCVTCENAPEWARFLYYAPFVVIFQFGWASTQISHLALIPELTPCENERVALNAIRYAFTVACNLFVYGVTYLLFKLNNSDQSDDNLSRADASKFMYLTFIVCGVGTIFQILFHCGTKENVEVDDLDENAQPKFVSRSYANQKALNWLGYLKSPSFYFVSKVRISNSSLQVFDLFYCSRSACCTCVRG
jgi:Na+/melibiose symporter-like transporter